MGELGVKNIIFGSSATVYGVPARVPITEDRLKDIPTNLVPYVAQVAIGKRESPGVFGNDCPPTMASETVTDHKINH